MSSQNLARIAIFGLFLAHLFEGNGQIFYPNAASVNDFHVGDTLMVDLENPYGPARLLLYCSYESAPRENETVPSSSSSPIPLALRAPASPNCYLELIQDPGSYLTSVIFSVSPSNGTVRTWSLGPQSEGQPSPAVVTTAVASPPTVTSVPINESVANARPPITLPDDRLETMYILADQTDCLVVTSSSSLHQGCWETLNLNQWLPQWFKETKKCALGSHSDINCQSQDHGPEPWTSTFLREYGISNDDCVHLDSVVPSCQDYHQAPFTQDEYPLLTARFEYVKSNIIAIARYFSAWHVALVDAASGAKDAIELIIGLIDIQHKKASTIARDIFITVLGVALGFIPVIGPEAGLSLVTTVAANAAIAGVKAVPEMAKTLWPAGGENTGVNQSDPSAFLAFAGQGTFSAPTIQGPAAGAASDVQKDILKQSMTTFLVSVALAQNDWQALLVPGVDAEGLFNGNKACPDWASSQCNDDEDAMRCHSHLPSGQCQDTYWWYSVDMYTLIHDSELDKDATNFLTQIFDRNWSTGPLLFENAAKCELQNLLIKALVQNYTYLSDANGQGAGFNYSSLIPGLDASYQQLPQGTKNNSFFLPIAGSGLVELGGLPTVQDSQYHPISYPFLVQTNGGAVDQSCVSDLNVTIASSWGGKHNWQ